MRLTFTLFLVFGFTLPGAFLQAQKLTALHHAGAATFYATPQEAYNAAVNGDTMYIPGGNFAPLFVSKSLTIIGAGHHPDSTAATGRTVLNYLDLNPGADNSYITGIYFSQRVAASGAIAGVTISRCYLNQGIAISSNTLCTNWIITENWIGNYSGGYSLYYSNITSSVANCYLSNNVIQNSVNNLPASVISNNIFLGGFFIANSSTIKNNIFSSNVEGYVSNSEWLNNMNAGVNGGPSGTGNTGSGNYLLNLAYSSLFAHFTDPNALYPNDLHVVNSGYTGADGQPVGIYGGAFPWKEGSLPFNPHIRAKSIGATTNPDGTLHINVTVKAQGN